MTNEQALYCIKAYSDEYHEMCEDCALYGKTDDNCFEECLKIVIKALEKSDTEGCTYCRYKNMEPTGYPCCECIRNHPLEDKFEGVIRND